MMRPVLAATLGIALTLVLSFVGQLATAVLLAAPDGAPLPIGRTFLSATLAITFGAAVLGGFVAALVSSAHRGRVTLAVALGAACSGILSATEAPPDAPMAIVWSLPVVALVGALAGGGVRLLNRSSRSPV